MMVSPHVAIPDPSKSCRRPFGAKYPTAPQPQVLAKDLIVGAKLDSSDGGPMVREILRTDCRSSQVRRQAEVKDTGNDPGSMLMLVRERCFECDSELSL